MSAPALKHDVFQAIADPTRRTVLQLLARNDMPIVAISENFPLSRTAINKHLHILSDAGLVSSRRVGRETRYRLQPERLIELKDWLAFFETYWDDRMSLLKEFVENTPDPQ
ncbi:ArsR family transcriptional regulator [Paenibacillus riograndensis]|uniref:ArsR family transcriptional regulator n=1 Tax=Paenibacillus riograndensis TaxID=483937 RepID=A0A132U882_9BACL|nr:metalloregulator ArsR/SmtB family transcription factor [Paenibacillus riograndensis]KWX79665.1 ArsR family transcriptional regulator [Paenibacillus riograndensis]KWX86085.1 ArsR family transcriptional regulator [Paenibacillus riograndensis]